MNEHTLTEQRAWSRVRDLKKMYWTGDGSDRAIVMAEIESLKRGDHPDFPGIFVPVNMEKVPTIDAVYKKGTRDDALAYAKWLHEKLADKFNLGSEQARSYQIEQLKLLQARHTLYPNIRLSPEEVNVDPKYLAVNIPTCDAAFVNVLHHIASSDAQPIRFKRGTWDVDVAVNTPPNRRTLPPEGVERIFGALRDLVVRLDRLSATGGTTGGPGEPPPRVHTSQELAQARAMHQQAFQQHRMHEAGVPGIAEHPHFAAEKAEEQETAQREASSHHDPLPTHDVKADAYALALTKGRATKNMIAKSRLTFFDDATRSRYASLTRKENELRLEREALANDRANAIASRYGE
jgi:hypothetical protein